MTAICVDDDPLLAEQTAELCRGLPQLDEAVSFSDAAEALEWIGRNGADLAVLDINMPGMNGIELARKILAGHPEMPVIFLTAYSEYAAEAFEIHASGYILKPADRFELSREIGYALAGRQQEAGVRVKIRTFGRFDVFVHGEMVAFGKAKCKELLAVLVDRRGSGMSRAEVFSLLWEDRMYDRRMQKQLDAIIRAMRETLRAYGISGIFEMKSGMLRIRPEMLDCDMYRFFDGDVDAINAFKGDYMTSYSWASMAEGYMAWKWGG